MNTSITASELIEIIEEMNKAVDKTLSITHYCNWELHSYEEGGLFSSPEAYVYSSSFKELIEKAYKRMKEKENHDLRKERQNDLSE